MLLSFVTTIRLIWKWHVKCHFILHGTFQIIVGCLFILVFVHVLSRYNGHWLFNNALHFALTMSLKFNENKKNPTSLGQYDGWWCWNCCWIILTSNIKKKVCVVFDSLCSFLKKYEGKNENSMFSLILTLVFKTFV